MRAAIAVACASMLSCSIVGALELDLKKPESIKSAAKSLAQDIVKTYYPDGGPRGVLPVDEEERSNNYELKDSAMLWDSLINYWAFTGDSQFNKIVSEALLAQVGESRDYFPQAQFKEMSNEDQTAWALAALTAAERQLPNPPEGQPQWLNLSKTVFDIQANRWETKDCGGGIRVAPYAAYSNLYYYKKPNGWFMILAARLGAYTGNTTYFDWVEKNWQWASTTGKLVTPDYAVYYGLPLTGGMCAMSPVRFEYTFNQAAYLYASAVVYNATGSDIWRKRVDGHLNRYKTLFVSAGEDVKKTNNGTIMTEIPCARVTGSCDKEERFFKSYAARWMSQAAVAAPSIAGEITPLLRDSATGAARTCTGTEAGKMCGSWWETSKYAPYNGPALGDQVSALEIIQQNLNGPQIKLANAKTPVDSPKGNGNPSQSGNGPASTNGGSNGGSGTGANGQGGNGGSDKNAGARVGFSVVGVFVGIVAAFGVAL